MKKFWRPLLGFLLLPALYSGQRPAELLVTARPPDGDSFPGQTQEPAITALVFPDYVDGGGWSVQLVISNVDPDAAAKVRVDVHDPDAQPVFDLFVSDLALEIPALGSRVLRSAGLGTIRRGWIQVETESASVSGLLTYRHAPSGIEVGVKPVELGPQFALFVEESSTVGAGVAVYKPDASPRIELRIRDEEGNDPLDGGFVPWEDFHQAARTLPEWFGVEGVDTRFLRDFRGLLFLQTEDQSSFAPLGLRFGKRTSSLSAVPAIRTQGEDPQEASLVFPDYVDGGGWSVQLVISNVDPDAAAEAVVEIYDEKGRPIRDLFDSELTLEIPSLGSRILRSGAGGAIRRGWIEVRTDAPAMSGLLTYRHDETGIEVSVEPAQPGKEFALFVEESGTIGAGLALFKPIPGSRIELRLRDEEGNDPLDGTYLPWRDFHQAARTLPEWFAVEGVDTRFLADFRGLVFVRTEDESGVAPLGLRFGKRTSSLSAVPAIRIPDGVGIDGGHPPPPTVTLSASPTSINRGQSTTLTWSATSAESAEITPDIGEVPTSGSRTVSPNVTTTYRITVTGADGRTATASVTVTVAVSERAALTALFEALSGSDWTHSENWLTDAPLGEWYGVEVDSQGRVIGLRMIARTETGIRTGIGLTGMIPPELGALSHLRFLDLSGNQLTGPIPPELGNLSQLEILNLGENRLTGPIPPELGSLSHLRSLHLGGNQLMGTIPRELGNLSQLQSLWLFGNQLTGLIPSELGDLSQLERLFLGNNQLSGPIPAGLSLVSNLRFLELSINRLTGSIPPEFGSLSRLEWLLLDRNQLAGPIPASLLQLQQLDNFHFFDNSGLCAPGTTVFITWLNGIERIDGSYCNESDMAVMQTLYRETGGANWTNSDGWLGEGSVGEWYGVRADSLGRVTRLDLSENGLTGHLPRNLGRLAKLTELRIEDNALTGRLPLELARLPLQAFHYADTELCAPVEQSFRVWLKTISSHEGSGRDCVPLTDHGILVALYQATDGPNWVESENWLTDAPLEEWWGVDVDVDGRVSVLRLENNNLQGPIPPELGQLSQLRRLTLPGNQLSGPILPELGGLEQLEILRLTGNDLTGPIPPELGELSSLTFLALGANALEGPIPPELGRLASVERLLLWGNNLKGSIPPELGNLSKAWILSVSGNNLSGPIPSEFGNLVSMKRLELSGNAFEGVIPPELGGLANLEILWLGFNELTGPIPPELGGLERLETLSLSQNNLTGPIPPELGGLASLKDLYLGENNLTGPIPSELQDLSILEKLNITNNDLTGTLPPEIGGMSSLRELALTNNSEMAGPLPSDLTALGQLNVLLAGGTDLCAPSNSGFQTWLKGVHKRRLSPCFEGQPPMTYLVQAVQSREFPVPLLAGEKALLRVFPTAGAATSQDIPAVRARFYQDGLETYVENIPGKTAPIPTEFNEGNLSMSANTEIPAAVIQPGLEMVIEVDPEGMLDPGLGVKKRIPEEGRLAVDVRTIPLFDLTLIPFLWSQDPDSSIVDLVEAIAEDAEGHEMLWHTRTLLPVGELEVTAHERVLSTSNNAFDLRANAQAIRAMEGGTGYYMGLMPQPVTGAAGVGFIATRVSFSIPNAATIAHELGHNLSLYHAPCGGAGGPDPSYPQTDGSIGAWGYDFREGGRLVPPSRPDLMTYCGPYWISDYHFTNALRYRLHTAGTGGQSSLVAAPGESLLLWGGVDAVGAPFLEPAFVVQAPASLPRSTGDYKMIGRTDDGDELFSVQFQMPEVADGDGKSSFAFILPVQPDWADQLASITLSGPGGSVTLDQDTNRPVTILRNPRTGQIRAILRGAEAALPNLDATVSALSLDPGLERLTSRGIPDPGDWTR